MDTSNKLDPFATVYCETCDKYFRPLGIMRHRAMHRDRAEDCTIEFTNGDVYEYEYSKQKARGAVHGFDGDLFD